MVAGLEWIIFFMYKGKFNMYENEKIDEIKEKILDRINTTLDDMTTDDIHPKDIQRLMVIKNLVESYDILNNTQEEI